MNPWLAICRGAVEDVRAILEQMPSRETRERVVGAGVGGDDTTAIDAAAEEAIVARLEEAHRGGSHFTLVSEELGERSFGGGETRLVVDPIDGSVNAKRGIPFFSLSLAVAQGTRMSGVHYGYVYDFGSGEEWTAERGKGAFLNGEGLGDVRPKDRVEILSFEGTVTPSIADRAGGFVGFAERLRVMGSLALSLCHLAAGRVDAVCSLKEARAVDIAAAQLLVRECGLAIDLPDAHPFADAPLDAEGRSRVVAGATPDICRELAALLE